MIPSTCLDFKTLPRPSEMRINRNRDSGSPCQRPLVAWKVVEGAPFTNIEKKDEDTRLLIHWTQSCWNPKALRVALRNCQLTLSYTFARSTLVSILGDFVCFKEWIISWVRMIPSSICLPSMNHVCYGDISPDIKGFILLAITFVIIFRITLQREIELNLPGKFAPFSFGINMRNVTLKALRIYPIYLDSSTTSQISSFTSSQQFWKKSILNPSGPRDFRFSIWRTTSSTSS